jgi:hypothetical protein
MKSPASASSSGICWVVIGQVPQAVTLAADRPAWSHQLVVPYQPLVPSCGGGRESLTSGTREVRLLTYCMYTPGRRRVEI